MRDLWKFRQLLYIILHFFLHSVLYSLFKEKQRKSCREKLYSSYKCDFDDLSRVWKGGRVIFNGFSSELPAIFQSSKSAFLSSNKPKSLSSGFGRSVNCLEGNFIMRHIYPLFRVHKFLIFHDVET